MHPLIDARVRQAVMSEKEDFLYMLAKEGLFDVLTTYEFEERDQSNLVKHGTILLFACLKIKPNAVRVLLDIEGPFPEYMVCCDELNHCLSLHNTMAYEASGKKLLQIIDMLLKNGIDPVLLSDSAFFSDLIQRSNCPIVDLLIQNYDIFQHPSNFKLHPFASLHLDKEYPLQMFASLMRMNFDEKDMGGKTGLYSVIEHMDMMFAPYMFTMVQTLLAHGADANARDDQANLTPFSLVVKWKRSMSNASADLRLRIGELLLKHGARFELPEITYVDMHAMERQREWYQRVHRALDPRTALATSMHPRLGQHSLLRQLPTDVHRIIFDHL